jgi:hypothetical protein
MREAPLVKEMMVKADKVINLNLIMKAKMMKTVLKFKKEEIIDLLIITKMKRPKK